VDRTLIPLKLHSTTPNALQHSLPYSSASSWSQQTKMGNSGVERKYFSC